MHEGVTEKTVTPQSQEPIVTDGYPSFWKCWFLRKKKKTETKIPDELKSAE